MSGFRRSAHKTARGLTGAEGKTQRCRRAHTKPGASPTEGESVGGLHLEAGTRDRTVWNSELSPV